MRSIKLIAFEICNLCQRVSNKAITKALLYGFIEKLF